MASTKHPLGLWATVISGTAVTAVLVSGVFTAPEIDRFGDPDRYTQIYSDPEVEQWGSNPVQFYVEEVLASMTLDQKIRSLIMANQPGTNATSIQSFVAGNELGGFIVMGSNVPETPVELVGITSAIVGSPELPRLIGIDEEGGLITRLPYDGFAGPNVLRNEPASSTFNAFTSRGELLKSLGVNLNFGIVADISSDPESFIYARSFGGDPVSTAERVFQAVTGEEPSVLSTIKHFPGHGSAPGDSHIGIPTSTMTYEQWLSSDALPFISGVDAGTAMVMFGHLSFPAIDAAPSSLSQSWHQILREQLGFTGVIITDDMTMLENSQIPEYADRVNNAVLALSAGNDVLLYVPSVNFDVGELVSGIGNAVLDGRITQAQLDESVRRVLTLRRELYPDAFSWIPPCDERCFIKVTF